MNYKLLCYNQFCGAGQGGGGAELFISAKGFFISRNMSQVRVAKKGSRKKSYYFSGH